MADRLILTAELVDEISARSKKLARALRDFYAEQKKLGDAARTQDRQDGRANQGKRFLDTTKQMHRELRALTGVISEVSPQWGRLGDEVSGVTTGTGTMVGTLAALGAVTLVTTKQLGDFGQNMKELRYASQTSGLSVTQLRQLEQVGTAFGVSAEDIRAGANNFAWATTKIVTNFENFRGQLAHEGFGEDLMGPMFQRLIHDPGDVSGAFDDLLGVFDEIRRRYPGKEGEVRINVLARMFGVPEAFGRHTREQYRDELKRVEKIASDMGLSPQKWAETVRRGEQFQSDMADTRQIFGNMGALLAHDIEPSFHNMVTDLNTVLTDPKTIEGVHTISKGLADIADDLDKGVKAIKWIEEHLPPWVVNPPTVGEITTEIINALKGFGITEAGHTGGTPGQPGTGAPGGVGGDAWRRSHIHPGTSSGGTSGGGAPGVGGPAPKNAGEIYNKLVDRFTGSKLDGYVPADGAQWGITKGTPQEWAKLALAEGMQESSLNPNAPGGGLYQFQQSDLQRYGVTGDVNDPNAQIEAMARQWEGSIPKAGAIAKWTGRRWEGAAAYFGPFRRPDEILKHMDAAGGVAGSGKAAGAAAGAAPVPYPNIGQMRSSLDGDVTASGHLDVSVNAPPGTTVRASGGGVFSTVNTRRAMPDEAARQ